jgi:hypothetical protein
VEYARDGDRCVVVRVESRAWYPNRDAAVVVDDDDDDDDDASTAAHAIARVADDDDDDAVAFDASARAARRATNIVVEQWRSIDRRRRRDLRSWARSPKPSLIYKVHDDLRLCPWYKYMRCGYMV